MLVLAGKVNVIVCDPVKFQRSNVLGLSVNVPPVPPVTATAEPGSLLSYNITVLLGSCAAGACGVTTLGAAVTAALADGVTLGADTTDADSLAVLRGAAVRDAATLGLTMGAAVRDAATDVLAMGAASAGPLKASNSIGAASSAPETLLFIRGDATVTASTEDVTLGASIGNIGFANGAQKPADAVPLSGNQIGINHPLGLLASKAAA
jgi:hypothetical protein